MNQTDRLKEYIEQLRKEAYEEGVKDATKALSKQMSALEKGQIRQGHWLHIDIKGYPYVACSKCGQIEGWDENTGMYCALVGEKYAHYCPCCGAKMDEEVKDE